MLNTECSCPWPSPVHVLINCQKQHTHLQDWSAQKTLQSKLLFSRTAWWQWLRFLQKHATNRYFGMVNSRFVFVSPCFCFFFIRQLCRIITISNSLVKLNGSSHGTAAALQGLCVLLYQLANQKCFESGCIEAHSHLRYWALTTVAPTLKTYTNINCFWKNVRGMDSGVTGTICALRPLLFMRSNLAVCVY